MKRHYVNAVVTSVFIPPLARIVMEYLPIHENYLYDIPLQGVNLHAMTTYNNNIYIVDNFSLLRIFDFEGKQLSKRKLPGVQNCRGIAVAKNGTIYLTDSQQNSVFVFSGHKRSVWKYQDLSVPWGIAVHEDAVAVVDRGHQAVKIFTLGGKLVSSFGCGHDPVCIIMTPQHIITTDNDVYNNHLEVNIFTHGGVRIHSIQRGEHYFPQGIALSSRNELYITNPCVYNPRKDPQVYVYNLHGEFVREFGMRMGEKIWHTNVCAVCNDVIIIKDITENRLCMFGIDIE